MFASNKKLYISVLVLTLFVLLSFQQPVFSQTGTLFDLANLRATNPTLTAAYEKINIIEAWEEILSSGKPLSEVILGVIDTDFDANHPEFKNTVNIGRTSFAGEVKNASHGTAVMGIIGADNVLGRGGILSPDSPQMNGILSGVLEKEKYVIGFRSVPELLGAKPIEFDVAVEELANDLIEGQATIINISLGLVRKSALTSSQQTNPLMFGKMLDKEKTFIKYSNVFAKIFSENPDILFVVAAGNQDVNVEDHVPGGSATLPNTIAVGATNLDDSRRVDDFDVNLIKKSNYGVGVAISAPGEDVYTPTKFVGDPNNPSDLSFEDYWHPQGLSGKFFGNTSAAAPMVTGVAGLIKAIKPLLTPGEIKNILIRTADTITTDKPIGGRLNAFAAVCDADVLNCSQTPPQLGAVLRQFNAPIPGNGRGMAFDGVDLYYTFLPSADIVQITTMGAFIKTITPTCPSGIPLARQFGALAFDGTGVTPALWAATYNFAPPASNIFKINISTGMVLETIGSLPSSGGFSDLIDGLAFDPGDNSLFYSGDLEDEVFNIAARGGAGCAPISGVQNTTRGYVLIESDISGHAFDGVNLYSAQPADSFFGTTNTNPPPQIFQTPTNAPTINFNFKTLDLSGGDFLPEDLAFDNVTFAPRCAIWANEATLSNNRIIAYEVLCP